VGIIAAQAVGEPGTQLTMRTFHTGGVAGKGGDITLGLPRVEELFEARTPSNPAVITEADGLVIGIYEDDRDVSLGGTGERVVEILPDNLAVLEKIGNKDEEKENKSKKAKKGATNTESLKYKIPFGKRILVSANQKVKAGDPLTEGPIDIKELFKFAGREAVENYILREVCKVYNSQGVSINDKHLEVIVRQMFSRYRIKDSGDTSLNIGNVVERIEFLTENDKAVKAGGKPAKASLLILPVSKVALSTSSFLSAASFQDTARVLINASVRGSRDTLRGLKENVIIGRLIPAGTGYRKDMITPEPPAVAEETAEAEEKKEE
jgi:DNA-directed RNA polymerase subunit beta'